MMTKTHLHVLRQIYLIQRKYIPNCVFVFRVLLRLQPEGQSILQCNHQHNNICEIFLIILLSPIYEIIQGENDPDGYTPMMLNI